MRKVVYTRNKVVVAKGGLGRFVPLGEQSSSSMLDINQ